MANEFPETEFRAKCLKVVDGDTVDLLVDIGFHVTFTGRFRVLGIDTSELNSKVQAERDAALLAKARTTELLILKPAEAKMTEWPLLARTKKDPDSFGRWLAQITVVAPDGTKTDLATTLLSEGLAKPYKA